MSPDTCLTQARVVAPAMAVEHLTKRYAVQRGQHRHHGCPPQLGVAGGVLGFVGYLVAVTGVAESSSVAMA